ncbi:putative DNA polymerase delta subunit 4-like protein, partial [Naja naja]
MLRESSIRHIPSGEACLPLPSKAKRKQLRHWLRHSDNNYTPHGLFRVVGRRASQLRSWDPPSAPARERRSGTSHGAMSRKRLITDSFQVVKKEGGREERKAAQAQSPRQ